MTLRAAAPALSYILPNAYTLATLPDPSLYPRMYAWVSDLFGGPGDNCISDGVSWKPVRPFRTLTMSAADSTLTTMAMAPTILVNGTIGTGLTRTLTFSTQYAYNGAEFRVTRIATGLGILLTSVGISLPVNGWSDFSFNGTSWIQTGSGGLV